MSALSSYLRADNFEGKREFLKEFNGLELLFGIIMNDSNATLRLHKKVLILLYDFVLNDDRIFTDNKFYVRNSLAENSHLVTRLFTLLQKDLKEHKYLDLREFILRILFYVV